VSFDRQIRPLEQPFRIARVEQREIDRRFADRRDALVGETAVDK